MKLCIYIIFLCFFLSDLNAQKIATFKFSSILEDLLLYQKFIHEVEEFKKKKFNELKKEEKQLILKKRELEDSKIILSENEYSNRISEFNNQTINFEKKVLNLNNYLQSNIEINEKIILTEISNIIKQIAINNDIEIVLSDEQYFLSSDKVDISNLILLKLKKIDLKLQLTDID